MAIALVTGANKGLGLEIARGLGKLGHTVLAAARNLERGSRAAAELADEGLDVRAVQLDVTDDTSVDALAARITDEFGGLDILVNNAGIINDDGIPSKTDLADLRALYETNVFGVVRVTNALLPLLRLSAQGRIVNMSSGLGSITRNSAPDTGQPIIMSYSSSKSALNAITVQYARELRDSTVRVVACAPGKCATDINDHDGDRTAAQGAAVAVALATDPDVPTGAFREENGDVPW